MPGSFRAPADSDIFPVSLLFSFKRPSQCAIAISTSTILELAMSASGPTTGASFPFLKT